MTHRAQQIVDEFAARVLTYVGHKGLKVYRHRRLTLDPSQDDLPAFSFDVGEDMPVQMSVAGVYSQLSVVVAAVFVGATEQEVQDAAIDMRDKCEDVAEIERTAPNGQKLGLSFVHSVVWGGADELEVTTSGRVFVAVYPFRWIFRYQMR